MDMWLFCSSMSKELGLDARKSWASGGGDTSVSWLKCVYAVGCIILSVTGYYLYTPHDTWMQRAHQTQTTWLASLCTTSEAGARRSVVSCIQPPNSIYAGVACREYIKIFPALLFFPLFLLFFFLFNTGGCALEWGLYLYLGVRWFVVAAHVRGQRMATWRWHVSYFVCIKSFVYSISDMIRLRFLCWLVKLTVLPSLMNDYLLWMTPLRRDWLGMGKMGIKECDRDGLYIGGVSYG